MAMVKKRLVFCLLVIAAAVTWPGAATAHDGWIQTNTAKVAVGDMCYIDMLFGNHGNMHRDYKVWGSKWDMTKSTFTLHTPKGKACDLRDRTVDVGMNEQKIVGGVPYRDVNGYLVASFEAEQQGIYIADVRQDTVVSYAPERSIKCAKAVVRAGSSTMGNYGKSLRGYNKALSQVLEIIPLNDPTDLAVGEKLTVQVLFKGFPLADACVSVIPRGKELPEMGMPNPYDLMTDMDGKISYTFTEANYHLIVTHVETDEAGMLDGKSYDFTKYTGDLSVIVRPPRRR